MASSAGESVGRLFQILFPEGFGEDIARIGATCKTLYSDAVLWDFINQVHNLELSAAIAFARGNVSRADFLLRHCNVFAPPFVHEATRSCLLSCAASAVIRHNEQLAQLIYPSLEFDLGVQLALSCAFGWLDRVQSLLQLGADPFADLSMLEQVDLPIGQNVKVFGRVRADSRVSLEMAVDYGHAEVVSAILQIAEIPPVNCSPHFWSPPTRSKDSPYTPDLVSAAFIAGNAGDPAIVNMILDFAQALETGQLPLSLKLDCRREALLGACLAGCTTIVQQALAEGWELNVALGYHKWEVIINPFLLSSSMHGHVDVVRSLLQQPTLPIQDAFITACLCGLRTEAASLLQAGASLADGLAFAAPKHFDRTSRFSTASFKATDIDGEYKLRLLGRVVTPAIAARASGQWSELCTLFPASVETIIASSDTAAPQSPEYSGGASGGHDCISAKDWEIEAAVKVGNVRRLKDILACVREIKRPAWNSSSGVEVSGQYATYSLATSTTNNAGHWDRPSRAVGTEKQTPAYQYSIALLHAAASRSAEACEVLTQAGACPNENAVQHLLDLDSDAAIRWLTTGTAHLPAFILRLVWEQCLLKGQDRLVRAALSAPHIRELVLSDFASGRSEAVAGYKSEPLHLLVSALMESKHWKGVQEGVSASEQSGEQWLSMYDYLIEQGFGRACPSTVALSMLQALCKNFSSCSARIPVLRRVLDLVPSTAVQPAIGGAATMASPPLFLKHVDSVLQHADPVALAELLEHNVRMPAYMHIPECSDPMYLKLKSLGLFTMASRETAVQPGDVGECVQWTTGTLHAVLRGIADSKQGSRQQKLSLIEKLCAKLVASGWPSTAIPVLPWRNAAELLASGVGEALVFLSLHRCMTALGGHYDFDWWKGDSSIPALVFSSFDCRIQSDSQSTIFLNEQRPGTEQKFSARGIEALDADRFYAGTSSMVEAVQALGDAIRTRRAVVGAGTYRTELEVLLHRLVEELCVPGCRHWHHTTFDDVYMYVCCLSALAAASGQANQNKHRSQPDAKPQPGDVPWTHRPSCIALIFKSAWQLYLEESVGSNTAPASAVYSCLLGLIMSGSSQAACDHILSASAWTALTERQEAGSAIEGQDAPETAQSPSQDARWSSNSVLLQQLCVAMAIVSGQPSVLQLLLETTQARIPWHLGGTSLPKEPYIQFEVQFHKFHDFGCISRDCRPSISALKECHLLTACAAMGCERTMSIILPLWVQANSADICHRLSEEFLLAREAVGSVSEAADPPDRAACISDGAVDALGRLLHVKSSSVRSWGRDIEGLLNCTPLIWVMKQACLSAYTHGHGKIVTMLLKSAQRDVPVHLRQSGLASMQDALEQCWPKDTGNRRRADSDHNPYCSLRTALRSAQAVSRDQGRTHLVAACVQVGDCTTAVRLLHVQASLNPLEAQLSTESVTGFVYSLLSEARSAKDSRMVHFLLDWSMEVGLHTGPIARRECKVHQADQPTDDSDNNCSECAASTLTHHEMNVERFVSQSCDAPSATWLVPALHHVLNHQLSSVYLCCLKAAIRHKLGKCAGLLVTRVTDLGLKIPTQFLDMAVEKDLVHVANALLDSGCQVTLSTVETASGRPYHTVYGSRSPIFRRLATYVTPEMGAQDPAAILYFSLGVLDGRLLAIAAGPSNIRSLSTRSSYKTRLPPLSVLGRRLCSINVDILSRPGDEALHVEREACRSIITELLKLGADLSEGYGHTGDETLLLYVVLAGDKELFRLLLSEYRSCVNLNDALVGAVRLGLLDLVQVLLAQGVSPNKASRLAALFPEVYPGVREPFGYPLHALVRGPSAVAICRALCEAGADVNAELRVYEDDDKRSSKYTPMALAHARGMFDVEAELLRYAPATSSGSSDPMPSKLTGVHRGYYEDLDSAPPTYLQWLRSELVLTLQKSYREDQNHADRIFYRRYDDYLRAHGVHADRYEPEEGEW